jgi:outer membrane protein assembly factor BamB
MIHSRLRLLVLMTIALPTAAGWFMAAGAPDRKDRVPPQVFNPPPSRNMVNLKDRNLPMSWSVGEGKFKNIKWSANLGDRTFGNPVIADGRVFVATNIVKGEKAVLMAFRESDGKVLWQNTHECPNHDFGEWEPGVPSMPAVDGDHLFYLAPYCELICARTRDGKIVWRYDMAKELKVFTAAANCPGRALPLGAPLVVGDLVFAITGNGRDWDKLVSPAAPSFVALNKRTGKLIWQSNLPGENVIEGQWSSPTFAVVKGVPQVIFAGGDCVIYSFEPETGKLLWKCDCLPARAQGGKTDNYIVGVPVVVGDRLYVGLGMQNFERPERRPFRAQASRFGYFLCLDITKRGDVSLKSYDPKSPANEHSALVWAFGGLIQPEPAKGRREYFGRTISTAAVQDGLAYISEENGYLYCLDMTTGQRYWEHDFRETIWGSPYWVDGKVYIATDFGEVHIFAHRKTKTLLAKIEMDGVMNTTPVAANGVLFVTTDRTLYAIAQDK